MANILVNGGVRITPTGRPPVVETYHKLKGIEGSLARFRSEFIAMQKSGRLNDLPSVEKLVRTSGKQIDAYSETLDICSKDVEQESLKNEMPDYYRLLKIFLSRASDAHTVLPYSLYLYDYANSLAINETDKWPYQSRSNHIDFIGNRIAEAQSVCKAYLCLLSSSMDSKIEKIDPARMIREILNVQKKVYMIKGFNEFHYKKIDLGWLEDTCSNFSLSAEKVPSIRNFAPLVYFIFEHIITNAMKATFLAATKQKNGNFNLKDFYNSGPADWPVSKPGISVSLGNNPNGSITADFIDNGIGMPKETLARLFSPNEAKTHFIRLMIYSNGSSLKLFPYIMDLTGISLHVESEVGCGAKFTLTIPKEAALN